MYTSGWPKNQNRFCQRMGLPPSTVKNVVPKFLSKRSITSALPSSGKENRMSPDCVSTVQEKMSRFAQLTSSARSVKMVAMKLIAPIVAETPVRWSPSSIRSTAGLGCWIESGVYIVQLVCDGAIPGMKKPAQMSKAPGGSNQNAMELMRGNAMSSAPISRGTK